MGYSAKSDRYGKMLYPHCGESGLRLPAISLGLWHNFGDDAKPGNMRDILTTAFDLGVTHFDLANNYGPPGGAAEENFGRILRSTFAGYRDEMIISTKAGYGMWEGPYGDNGSKKYLVASLDQSLKRMGLDYVDIFYHHRPDSGTPLEETMGALDLIVRQGKALYVGVSNYPPEDLLKASEILKTMGTKLLIHQPSYSMFNRKPEDGLFDAVEKAGVGCIVFSPLFKGVLTDRYLNGVPADSRAAGPSVFLKPSELTDEILGKVKKLNEIAMSRGQAMSQMALAWVLRDKRVTSALIGASRPSQVEECVKALDNLAFTQDELDRIEDILK